MTESTDWVYYAVFETPQTSAERPGTVLRRRPDALRHDSERLTRDGDWRPSDLVARIFMGDDWSELEEITRDRAAELAREWLAGGRLAAVPPDLLGS